MDAVMVLGLIGARPCRLAVCQLKRDLLASVLHLQRDCVHALSAALPAEGCALAAAASPAASTPLTAHHWSAARSPTRPAAPLRLLTRRRHAKPHQRRAHGAAERAPVRPFRAQHRRRPCAGAPAARGPPLGSRPGCTTALLRTCCQGAAARHGCAPRLRSFRGCATASRAARAAPPAARALRPAPRPPCRGLQHPTP